MISAKPFEKMEYEANSMTTISTNRNFYSFKITKNLKINYEMIDSYYKNQALNDCTLMNNLKSAGI